MVRSLDRRRSRGLTLIEISAVVVIVGILALLAVVGYRKLINNARFAEATSLVGNIRAGQTAHFAEVGYYADISLGLGKAHTYPKVDPGGTKTGWGPRAPRRCASPGCPSTPSA
jgi:type IV pilus assembly protein PilA